MMPGRSQNQDQAGIFCGMLRLIEEKKEDGAEIIGPEQLVSNEEYLERILENSAAKNLALRVRQERELEQDA